ncbi:hypothetical protein QFC22_000777 [Naganishia vaughanmartiniae]|uniref:Uncharacterized protein n=1 Tax=Naganishia vaughanmartiniae TaxID=1424756 RepID=A0ACC2XIY6_9TREE|nr:hypothetical protein QFC22_000777 [Naganishia vaughanmartiniae]
MKDLFGHKWKAQRLAGQHAFSSNANLQSFGELILPKHLNTLLAPIEKSIERDEELDVQEVAYDYAMVVFGELAYDSDFAQTSAAFTAPFERASTVTQDRFTNPLYRFTERLFPSGRRFQRDVAEVKAFGERLVRSMSERIKAEEEGEIETPGVDGSQGADGSTIGQGLLLRELVKEHGQGDNYRFLADACLNFLTAGKDTTAQALAWTLYEILRSPAIYAELQAEIDKAPTELEVSDLTAVEGPLQYTNAVISESLRLHPPVPLEIHENTTSAPIALADGSLVGPAEIVLWSPWVMGRSTRIWGEDAADFKPSRWFPEVQPRKSDGTDLSHPLKKSAFEFPVFHAGPRSCLGKNLARIELAYALVQLVKRYEMVPTWPLNQEKSVGTALTAPILGGLGVRARHRQKI